jgi:hypothetical protein
MNEQPSLPTLAPLYDFASFGDIVKLFASKADEAKRRAEVSASVGEAATNQGEAAAWTEAANILSNCSVAFNKSKPLSELFDEEEDRMKAAYEGKL